MDLKHWRAKPGVLLTAERRHLPEDHILYAQVFAGLKQGSLHFLTVSPKYLKLQFLEKGSQGNY